MCFFRKVQQEMFFNKTTPSSGKNTRTTRLLNNAICHDGDSAPDEIDFFLVMGNE